MRTAMAAMVELAEPLEVCARLDPRADLVRVADPGVIVLEPLQVDTVLQGELDVSVMQLERLVGRALAEIATVGADRALRRLVCAASVGLEIDVVRVAGTRLVSRVVHGVAMRDRLIVRLRHRYLACVGMVRRAELL